MATAKKQKGATKRSDATVVPRKKPVRLKAKTSQDRIEKLGKLHAVRKVAQTDVVESLSARIPQVVAEDAELNAILSETNRPTTYTEALGTRISDLLVAGLSVMKIAKMPGMPSEVRMFRWIGTPDHPFSAIYKEAKALMVSRFEEEIQAISDEPHIGELVTTREVYVDGALKTITEVRKVDMFEHRKQAQVTDDKPNEQLNALFAALKAGPADTNG
jgi:hypothetical protein